MINRVFIALHISALFFVLSGSAFAAPQTMRLDYYHTGNSSQELFSIDRVVIEPSDAQPERIQIWGAFSFAMRQFGDQYSPPVRGYLYYQLPPEKPGTARAEWADIHKVAGTGQKADRTPHTGNREL